MQQIIVLCLGLLFSLSSFATSKKCEAPLGARPDRKTLGVGALLQLKSKLKTIGTGVGVIIQVPTDELHLHKSLELGRGGWRILPGMQLRTLSAYQKVDGIAFVELEVPGTEMRGFMYWTDVYRNMIVLEPGRPAEVKPKKTRLMFADKIQPYELWGKLEREGKTSYGRPLARRGDLVWLANHTRVMSSRTVGWVLETSDESALAKVKTLSGKTVEIRTLDCNPLTEEEAKVWVNPSDDGKS